MDSISRTIAKVRKKLALAPPSAFVRGIFLRRKFTRSGLIIVQPGRPGVRIKNHGGTIICENVAFFPGVRLECFPGARISLGNGTYLNRNTEIIAAEEVAIGRDCLISWDVLIMDTNQHGIWGEPPIARPVIIGSHVWIGARAVILPGVTIGDYAIVGAAAVVTKDVPPRTAVAGNPARPIRTQ